MLTHNLFAVTNLLVTSKLYTFLVYCVMEPGAGEYHRYNEPDPEMCDRGQETPHQPLYATMVQCTTHSEYSHQRHTQTGNLSPELWYSAIPHFELEWD